jgi:hypothetical protein
MSGRLKALERGLGLTRCPHCRGLLKVVGHVEDITDDELDRILATASKEELDRLEAATKASVEGDVIFQRLQERAARGSAWPA